MDFQKLYQENRKSIWLFVTILAVMISVTVFENQRSICYSDTGTAEMIVNTTLADNLEMYAGIFSTAVTTSVNPTATLAALSILGAVENADVYFPDVEWLVNVGDTLKGVPFVRTVSDLPVANPGAAVLLTIVAVVMYILHSTSGSKMISNATLDKIEQWGGFIVTVALALMPLATTQVVAAGAVMENDVNYVTPATYAITLIVGILSAVFNGVVYMCIYGCIDAIELLGAAVPVKGMNMIIQIAKAVLHMLLLLLQLFSPVLSVAFSAVIMIVGIALFGKMKKLSTYYMYIYVKPMWKSLWHSDEKTPLLHKKFPRRGCKYYEGMTLAIPAFSMNRLAKFRKRDLLWLIASERMAPRLIRVPLIGKPKEMTLEELNPRMDTVYLQKTFRFTRVITEDKQIELIISNEYINQWEELLAVLGCTDYKIVEEERKRKKALKRQRTMDACKEKLQSITATVTDGLTQEKY